MADVKTDLDMGDVWMMLARSWLRNNKRKTPKSTSPTSRQSDGEMGLMPTDREKPNCMICGRGYFQHTEIVGLGRVCPVSAVTYRAPPAALALLDTEPQGDDEPIVTEAMIEAGELELPHAYGRKKAAEIVTRIYTAMHAAATGGGE